MIFPFGRRERLPSDDLTRRCADLLMADSGTRERLTQNTVCAAPAAGIRSLQEAFQIVLQSESAWDKFKKSDCETFAAAMSAGAISESDRSMLKLRVQAVDKVIAVDDFSPEELCAN
jgi:acyl-CoA dehydrogenase